MAVSAIRDANGTGTVCLQSAASPAGVLVTTLASTAQTAVTVPGLKPSDVILAVLCPDLAAGMFVQSWTQQATTVTVTIGNFTAGSLTPATGLLFSVLVARP